MELGLSEDHFKIEKAVATTLLLCNMLCCSLLSRLAGLVICAVSVAVRQWM